MPAMYLTLAEFMARSRDLEAIDQSSELDSQLADRGFISQAISAGSNELNSMLGVRYAIPLPLSEHVKDLCFPLAHWWAERQGEKRAYIQAEYERAIALIIAIARGQAILLGADDRPAPMASSDQTPQADGVDFGFGSSIDYGVIENPLQAIANRAIS